MRDHHHDYKQLFRANAKLLLFVAGCVGLVAFYLTVGSAALTHNSSDSVSISTGEESSGFSEWASDVIFSGYSESGKGWQLHSESADLFSGDVVNLRKVEAHSVDADGKQWTLVADKGNYHREARDVFLEGQVGITSDAGEKINTETLSMDLDTNLITTPDEISILRNKTIIEGTGAHADRTLSTMTVQKDVTVREQPGADEPTQSPRVTISCDGHMDIDYKKNFAVFYDNVKVIDKDSVMFADKMEVFFDAVTNQLVHAIAYGEVEIITGDKRAVGDHAEYFEESRTMVLTGNPYVYRDADVITADKITFFTDDGRMVCEPAAKLVLFPSKDSEPADTGSEPAGMPGG